MMRTLRITTALLVALCLGGYAAAEDLVTFNFGPLEDGTEAVGDEASFSTTSDFGSTAANIEDAEVNRGAGMGAVKYVLSFAGSAKQSVDYTTLADAITNDHYFTFTLTPSTGYQVDLTQLDFRFSYQNATAAAIKKIALLTSVDSFATPLGDYDVASQAADFSADLTSLGTQTDPVEFRFYPYDPNGQTGWNQRGMGRAFDYWGDDGKGNDIVVIGTVSEAAGELLAGDANGDGQVDGNDLISVEENFGATGDPGLAGDANGDGQVDGNDLISVEENFGATSGAASVPEPASLLLLGLCGATLLRTRR